jgi:hypothetical protein
MNDLTYCIVPYPASADQYDAAIEIESTVRRSLDDSECVLKWSGTTPLPFDGLPTLTHSEALALMQTAAWQDDVILGGP